MKAFIKNNCDFTNIELKLCNYRRACDEKLAYRPEEYGKTILLQRRITAKGVSTFWTKHGSNERIISTGSQAIAEIKNICEHFRIKIDNPATILTQEVSKKFLNSTNPSKLYEFFKEASILGTIEKNISECVQNIDEQNEQIEDYRSRNEAVLGKLQDLQKQIDILHTLENNSNSIQNIEKELEWAMVYECSKAVKDIEDERNKSKVDENLEKLNQKLTEFKESFKTKEKDRDDCRQKQTEHNENIDDMKKVYEKHREETEVKEKDVLKAMKEYNFRESEIKKAKQLLKKHENELQEAEKGK